MIHLAYLMNYAMNGPTHLAAADRRHQAALAVPVRGGPEARTQAVADAIAQLTGSGRVG